MSSSQYFTWGKIKPLKSSHASMPAVHRQPQPPLDSPFKEEVFSLKYTKPLPRWGWIDNNLFLSFLPNDSDEIERAYQTYNQNPSSNNNSQPPEVFKKGLIIVDFVNWTTVIKDGKVKPVVRGTWFYYSDEECYMAYEEDVSFKLESIIQSGHFDEVEVSSEPYREVRYIGNGNFRQYRHTKNAKKEGRVVTRGWMGFMLKDGMEFQFKNLPKSTTTYDNSSSSSNSNNNINNNHNNNHNHNWVNGGLPSQSSIKSLDQIHSPNTHKSDGENQGKEIQQSRSDLVLLQGDEKSNEQFTSTESSSSSIIKDIGELKKLIETNSKKDNSDNGKKIEDLISKITDFQKELVELKKNNISLQKEVNELKKNNFELNSTLNSLKETPFQTNNNSNRIDALMLGRLAENFKDKIYRSVYPPETLQDYHGFTPTWSDFETDLLQNPDMQKNYEDLQRRIGSPIPSKIGTILNYLFQQNIPNNGTFSYQPLSNEYGKPLSKSDIQIAIKKQPVQQHSQLCQMLEILEFLAKDKGESLFKAFTV